jgi:hypothetical protein
MPKAPILVLFASTLTGCVHQPPPQQTLPVSNPSYKIDLLFKDPNGCSIYRFFDQGDYRYYVVGSNGSAQMIPSTHTVTETDTDTVYVPVPADHHHR